VRFFHAHATQFVAIHAPEILHRVAMKNVGAIQRELCRTTCNKIDLVLFCWRKNFREKNKALLFRKIARVYQVVATRCTLVSRMFTSSFLWQFTHLFVAGLLGVGVGTYWGKCWFEIMEVIIQNSGAPSRIAFMYAILKSVRGITMFLEICRRDWRTLSRI